MTRSFTPSLGVTRTQPGTGFKHIPDPTIVVPEEGPVPTPPRGDGGGDVAGSMLFVVQAVIDNRSSSMGIADGGGNRFPIAPELDNDSSCTGFDPAKSFGQLPGRPLRVALWQSHSTPRARHQLLFR